MNREDNNRDKHNDKGIEEILLNVEAFLTKPTLCKCGYTFKYQGLGVYKCEHCGEIFKNEYAKVRDFVDEYGTNYNILEIAEQTGVSKRLIDMFIKDKRFDTVKKQKKCIVCKTPIEKGQYCNRCALIQIQDEMDAEHKKMLSMVVRSGDMKGEMHFIKKDKKKY